MRSPEYSVEARERLLGIAQDSIAHGASCDQPLLPEPATLDPALLEPRASFVTLFSCGRLRGCMGSLEAREPLAHDVALAAYRSAARDPRFRAVSAGELAEINIEVAVLSPLQPMVTNSRRELIEQIVPGVDGLVIDDGERRATFLPKVWANLPEIGSFLDELWLKAGFVPGDWPVGLQVHRYRVESFERSWLAPGA